MDIITFSGRTVRGPADNKNYWADRKDHDLYRLMVGICRGMFPTAGSAIDVGCYTSGLILEMDWIPRRVASDLQKNLVTNWAEVTEVEFIAGNAFGLKFESPFDLVISNQTIEHLEDPPGFVAKLLSIGRGLVISTTYETPAGMIPGHIQDPISLDKFRSWFPVPLDSWTICFHPSGKIGHIIGVIKRSHPNAAK
jgi:SAM-dependent methyltransferase